MIVLGAGVFVGLISAMLNGSASSALALRFARPALAWLAVGCQLVAVWLPVPDGFARGIHLASYALIGVWLWTIRRLAGVAVIVAGALTNSAAIVANGGVMPASPAAVASAGLRIGGEFSNSRPVDGARLAPLGDVLAVPAGWPGATVFSLGDVLIAAGAAWLLCRGGVRWNAEGPHGESSKERSKTTETVTVASTEPGCTCAS